MRSPKTRMETAPDEQLMALIQAGDSNALNALYDRYSKRLLIYFYRMLGSEEKAQDFLQDIFLKVTEHPDAFDTNRIFSKWIFSIAANMCKNEYRSMEVRIAFKNNRMGAMITSLESESQIEARLDQVEFKRRLLREIGKLDADQRSTFLLRFQEDFSIKEIAQILNCSGGTVKSRLFYITRKLAVKLRNFDPSTSEVNHHGSQKQ